VSPNVSGYYTPDFQTHFPALAAGGWHRNQFSLIEFESDRIVLRHPLEVIRRQQRLGGHIQNFRARPQP
jgi:hypothetical protein